MHQWKAKKFKAPHSVPNRSRKKVLPNRANVSFKATLKQKSPKESSNLLRVSPKSAQINMKPKQSDTKKVLYQYIPHFR